MRCMIRKTLLPLLLLAVSLLFYCLLCFPVSGDVAPARPTLVNDYESGSNGAISQELIREHNISMDSFYVNVTVDMPQKAGYSGDPDIHEQFTYFMVNPTNRTITLDVIIPICFDRDSFFDEWENCRREIMDTEKAIREVSLKVNNVSVSYNHSWITELDPELGFPHHWELYGFTTNITFHPNSTTKIELNCFREIPYTYNCNYFYSARTGSLWNGSIRYGYFNFSYVRDFVDVISHVPNATYGKTMAEIRSEVWGGQGDDYSIDIKTGVVYAIYDPVRPPSPSDEEESVLDRITPLHLLTVTLSTSAVVLLLTRRRLKGRKPKSEISEEQGNFEESSPPVGPEGGHAVSSIEEEELKLEPDEPP